MAAFLDSNVLIYSVDRTDSIKNRTARKIVKAAAHGGAAYAISVQTLTEFSNVCLKFNVLDFEKLRDAQKRPWRYENLQVRVCGWNVRWNDLPKAEQDKYILRAEKAVW